jgi:GNAT superfamily N-acetyltransferase
LVQVTFAVATGDDAVVSFVRSHVAEVFDSDLADPWAHYSRPGHAYWVAEANAGLVGMAGVEQWPGVSGTARLRHVMVDPSWQRRGIASTILEMAERWCVDAGYDSLRLTTTDLNAVALGIYRSRGYREIGRDAGQVAISLTMDKDLRPSRP